MTGSRTVSFAVSAACIAGGVLLAATGLAGPESWTNVDDSPHQVTVQGETTLRTPVVLKGQSTELKFEYPGTYGYICGLHPAMKGAIEVTK